MVQAEQAVERKVNRKTRTGVVVSDVNDQTVIVSVASASRHRLYRKVIRRTKRYPVHDPENSATTGDLVVIEECRPISKTKRWRLVEVITEREVAEVAPESIDEALVDEVQRTAARAAAEAEEVAEAEAPEATAEAPADGAPAEAAMDEAPEEPLRTRRRLPRRPPRPPRMKKRPPRPPRTRLPRAAADEEEAAEAPAEAATDDG